ncbi:MAG: DNA methyltransferase [Saprospiraceae bacterium]
MIGNSQYRTFDEIPVNQEWCFKNIRSTEQWTHGYHRYPAKFLPNLVQKLIEEYTNDNDIIADFFAGCGTTLVEAKVHGRRSIGVDINPVAELITKAKINAIDPRKIEYRYKAIKNKLNDYNEENYKSIYVHDRIDYWYSKEHKSKIAFLYESILSTRNSKVRDFLLVALSHILKNTSRWLQSSTKPQIDPNKKPVDPFIAFQQHTNQMIKRNKAYYEKLVKDKLLNTKCEIKLEDARKTSIRANSISAIITSPPYVTSYEYADIHQLTAYWYEYISDLPGFRRNFIGTFYSLNKSTECSSQLAQKTVNALLKIDKRTAQEVANYFNDMQSVAKEMKRVLKKGGHACLVIGNTTLKNTKIKSAEVFTETLSLLDFEIIDVIKRSIPNKLIPTIRDKKTGRFTKLNNKNSKLIYPEEYIIIAKKID